MISGTGLGFLQELTRPLQAQKKVGPACCAYVWDVPSPFMGLLLSHSICRAWPRRLQAQRQGCPSSVVTLAWIA